MSNVLGPEWRTSTRSQNNGQCVEVRLFLGLVEVRDTKDRNGPVHMYTPAEWRAFIQGVQDGEFELPA